MDCFREEEGRKDVFRIKNTVERKSKEKRKVMRPDMGTDIRSEWY